MKTLLVLGVALVGSMSYGSHTVCSSPNLYYSSVRVDSGPPPQPGMKIGQLTIVARGKVLVDHTYFAGLGAFVGPKYGVKLVGPKTELKTFGNQAAGSAIYTETAVLTTLAPHPVKEVLRTPVVCETAWAFPPRVQPDDNE